jgi:hypothetical protein
MIQPPSKGPSDMGAPLNPETARIVLRMDTAISAFRAGEGTGLPALDSASRLMGDLADDAVGRAATQRDKRPRIPRRPDRVELAILTALADTYGAEILSNASLGYALRLVARHGGIALVQRVLWGESAADRQLATMLGAARVSFEEVVSAFSNELLAQAHDVLAEFRPRPTSGPKSGQGDRG